jgi:hypothetical protein
MDRRLEEDNDDSGNRTLIGQKEVWRVEWMFEVT